MSADYLVGHLRTVDFLAGLDSKQLDIVAQGARVEQFLSGERVVQQGGSGVSSTLFCQGARTFR